MQVDSSKGLYLPLLLEITWDNLGACMSLVKVANVRLKFWEFWKGGMIWNRVFDPSRGFVSLVEVAWVWMRMFESIKKILGLEKVVLVWKRLHDSGRDVVSLVKVV